MDKYLAVLLLFILVGNTPAQKTYKFDTYTIEQTRADLKTLYNRLDTLHYNLYHKNTKAIFDSVYIAINNSINQPLNQFEFYWRALPLFNLLRDSHSLLGFPFAFSKSFSAQGGKFLPFKVIVKNDDVFIVEDYSKSFIVPYSQLISINNKPVHEIINDLKILSNRENPASEDDYISFLFNRLLFPLYGFDAFYKVEVLSPQKKKKVLTLNGISIEAFPKIQQQPFRSYFLGGDLVVLDINVCDEAVKFAMFCDSLFTQLNNIEVSNLVIDIRDNPGGTTALADTLFTYITNKKFSQYPKVSFKKSSYTNNGIDSIYTVTYNDDLARATNNPHLYKGNVFMLADINTFSSASVMAATFKCYNMGTLVGEETGGMQVFFDEPVQLALPNTGLRFLVSPNVYWSPCGTAFDKGIIPDYIVPWNIKDKRKGVDTQLKFVEDFIKNEK